MRKLFVFAPDACAYRISRLYEAGTSTVKHGFGELSHSELDLIVKASHQLKSCRIGLIHTTMHSQKYYLIAQMIANQLGHKDPLRPAVSEMLREKNEHKPETEAQFIKRNLEVLQCYRNYPKAMLRRKQDAILLVTHRENAELLYTLYQEEQELPVQKACFGELGLIALSLPESIIQLEDDSCSMDERLEALLNGVEI